MHRVMRSASLLLALLAPGAAVEAQAAYDEFSGRGPRFLLSDAVSSPPVRVEPGKVPILRQRITVRLENVPLEDALGEISRQSSIPLVYSANVVAVNSRTSLVAEGISVAAALTEVLLDANVDVVISGGQAVLVRRETASPEGRRQEPGTVVGRVTEAETKAPIPNVQIVVDGAGRAFTNDDGRYRIERVPAGRRSVSAFSIGYARVTQEVDVPENETVTLDFELEISPTPLADLVVTATGRQRRVELGNDITVLNVDSIVATEPVTSVTDVLEGRVPGLVVQRTSGAPGDPARLRLRGASSPRLSNDPIVIMDGVRVYSEQSDERGSNLAGLAGAENYAAPSPLDYIDPNTIETIQVVKGPSAATLFGQDAANGVIVITTKRGQEGPARWTTAVEHGQTRIAGEYPDLYFRQGHLIANNTPVFCPISNQSEVGGSRSTGDVCQADRLIAYQMLNDPELTVLDRGQRTGVTVGVSGGNSGLTYSATGSYRDEVGLIALPAYEAERYQAAQGTAPPDWMRRPQNLTRWGASTRIMARLGSSADVSLTSNLSRTEQQRSSLERQLGTLMSTFFDEATGTYYEPSNVGTQAERHGSIQVAEEVLADYYQRATATATKFTNAVNLNWRPFPWLTATADAGLDVVQRADEVFLPTGFGSGVTSEGGLQLGQGSSVISTVNVQARAQASLGRGFQFRFATGVNYTDRSIEDLGISANGLAEGTESVNGAQEVRRVSERRDHRATFGWYIEPGISHRRFWLSTGLRLDGGSTFGSNLELPSFPKLSFSYLISDEPYFPAVLRSVFNTLRLRAAYGHAGRQPGPADRLRLYGAKVQEWVGEEFVDAVFLETLGNTELKPERTREFEGGFDADLLDDRVSLGFTYYRKTTEDALLDVPVAPSVYGTGVSVLENIGVVRNTGMELSVGVEPVRSDPVTWRADLQVSRNRNIVVELGPGVEPFYTEKTTGLHSGTRVAPGYPLFGRWSRPVLGYADANGNGVLEEREVLIGDTLVYVGVTLPDYTANLHSTLSLLRGAFSVSVGLLYEDGMTQRNEVAERLAPFSRGWNDPSSSLAEQAAVFDASEYTWIQTVNTLRLNSLSIRYQVPTHVARRLGAEALSLSVQGTNLGLWTNYRGMDPNVNARATGNSVIDTGVLPQPRTWQVRVNASY